MIQPDRTLMTLWRMRTACWISKATNAHSDHVILHDFHSKKWLPERASTLRFMYIACLILV